MKIFLIGLSFVSATLFGQINGTIIGKVIDKNTQEPLPFVKVVVEGNTYFTSTDLDGNYRLEIPTGTYSLMASFVGYEPAKKFNIVLNSGNAQIINFELSTGDNQLETVEVVYNQEVIAKTTDMVTPLSVQKLTTEEIKSNPGGNFDVSKVIQSLPGVGGSAGGAARNDIIIRGGRLTKTFIIWMELKYLC